MTDQEFLCWIHERLEYQNGDNPLMDFMHKLRMIIQTVPNYSTASRTKTSYSSLISLKKDLKLGEYYEE